MIDDSDATIISGVTTTGSTIVDLEAWRTTRRPRCTRVRACDLTDGDLAKRLLKASADTHPSLSRFLVEAAQRLGGASGDDDAA